MLTADEGREVTTRATQASRRSERRRLRSLVELGAVVLGSLVVYAVAVVLNLFERLDRSVDLHDRFRLDEVLLVLPFTMVWLATYSWRRYREAQAETGVAMAAERALARTTEEYRSLFDYHPHAVFSIDPERRYRRLNPAAVALSGYREEELRSRTFPALKTPDRERILSAFERALHQEPQRVEASLVRKDGQRREVDVTMVPIVVDGAPEGVYVVAGDITDDNRLRRELARALTDAEQANEAKTLLVANVSHELRTPLTSVIGAVEVLADSDLADSSLVEVHERMVAMISRNGHVLLRLVDDLLDLTRMEAGQLAIEAVPFDLCEMLDQTVAHASSRASTKGLTFRVEMDDPPPGRVVGDPLRLGQVFSNVLGNAVKFTDEGEVGLALSWRRRDDEWLETVFRVWDTGIGIAADDQERLFGHFVQADPSSTRRYGGVGLGLAISRQLMQLMGGALSVESQAGVGSTFTIRLPLQLAEGF